MEDSGWLKLHRQLKQNPVVMKDGDHLALWVFILLNAAYEPIDVDFGGKKITLAPGQFTTGRKEISRLLKIDYHKIDRVLRCFESEKQIGQQMGSKCRLITVLNWSQYQKSGQLNGQQVGTNKETKNTERNKKEKNTDIASAIAPAEIISVFEVFKVLATPSYGNKTQRAAIEDMVKSYGLEKTLGAATYAVSIQSEKYAPIITNPYQLKAKFGELVAFKSRQDKSMNKSLVAEI